MKEKARTVPNWKSPEITPETYERLLSALDTIYPGRWRRSVDVCPVSVNSTIDNEPDALETIRRIGDEVHRREERRSARG